MIKKYGIGLLAVVIAIASFAFTAPAKTHLAATHVFEFDGLSNAYTVVMLPTRQSGIM